MISSRNNREYEERTNLERCSSRRRTHLENVVVVVLVESEATWSRRDASCC